MNYTKLFFVFLIPIFYTEYLSPQENPSSAYGHINWRNVQPPVDFSGAPSLAANEEVNFWDGLIYAKDRIVLPLKVANQNRKLLVWKPGSEARRLDLPAGTLSTVAYYADKDAILVLSGNTLYTYDRSSMEQISSAPSSVRAGSWVDSGIRSNEWTIRQGDTFTVYRLPTLEKIREFSAPNSAKGAQRAMFLSSGDILLNSTYWGAILKRFTPGSPVATEEQPPVPHRALLRMAQMNESQFVVFDPLSATMISLENHGSVWSALSSGTQVFGNWTAVRTDPREGRMRATLTGKAKADGDLKVLIALPPGETYSQEIKNERFISGSAMRYDRFGNRLLEITIPVRAGEEKNIELYSGDITRYSISVDLNAFRASISDFDTPTNANLFLADHTTYALHDPTVEAKRNELRNGTNDYLELLRRTMIYSNSIPYKSDGRFDPAPVVIRQNHGACTEHTFVTVSILRGAGIPARYVWNYLGTEQPELNHKIAEAWLPGFGWIPMEVLAPPGRVPGTTYAHHIIWAVYDQWASSLLRGGDTLFNISGVPVESGIVRWSLETETARERSTQTIRSRSFQVQERSVVE